VEALVREILADPARDWRAAGMARRLHCCPDHFTRAFRAITGSTPSRFVVGARIAAAKGLLRASSLSVTAVAEALGYSDVYFFSKQFRRETGTTPTQYRAGA
jgi:AraC-like DNA-binding protein